MFNNKNYKLANDENLGSYAQPINEIRSLIGQIFIAKGINNPSDQDIQEEYYALLERAKSITIPAIERMLSLTEKRTPELYEPLKDLNSPEELLYASNFIRTEIIKYQKVFVKKFLDLFESLKTTIPNLSMNDVLTIVQIDKRKIYSSLLEKYGEDINEVFRKINLLKQEARNKTLQPWNKVLSQHQDTPELEKWKRIPYQPISWDLTSILEREQIIISIKMEDADVPSPEKIAPQKRGHYELIYDYFYPEDNQIENPRQYALDKLRELVENGYDSHKICYPLGMNFIKRDGVTYRVNTSGLAEDKVGSKIKGYFTHWKLCNRNLNQFKKDLEEAGCGQVNYFIDSCADKALDERYPEFNFTYDSGEEQVIINLLRNDYKLDPIPFPVAVPCPTDNPTSLSIFQIDFLLPCDVLEYCVDGEPVIKSSVIFIGEYYGYSGGKTLNPKDYGKPFVNPDGSEPWYEDAKKEKLELVQTGNDVTFAAFYKFKTSWKMFTYEALADMLGTSSLAFEESDTRDKTGKKIMQKLDANRIIYNSDKCHPNYGCGMLREMEMFAPGSEITQKYLSTNHHSEVYESEKNRSLRILECAIIKLKFSEFGFAKAVQQYSGSGGWNRETLYSNKLLREFHQLEIKRSQESIRGLLARGTTLSDADSSARQNRIKQLQDQISSNHESLMELEHSPLKEFKIYFENLLDATEISEKLAALEQLKYEIENNTISISLEELKNKIVNEIYPEAFSKIAKEQK